MYVGTFWSIKSKTNFHTWLCSNESWIRTTWINDKNNVYKTGRKEIIHIMFFIISNLESAITYKSGRVVLSCKLVHCIIKKLIYIIISIFFPNNICTILSTVSSTRYFPCLFFFFNDCTWKYLLSNQTIHSCFVKGRPSVRKWKAIHLE